MKKYTVPKANGTTRSFLIEALKSAILLCFKSKKTVNDTIALVKKRKQKTLNAKIYLLVVLYK